MLYYVVYNLQNPTVFTFFKVSSATGSDDYDAPYPSVEEGDSGMSAGRSYGIKQNNPTRLFVQDCYLMNLCLY